MESFYCRPPPLCSAHSSLCLMTTTGLLLPLQFHLFQNVIQLESYSVWSSRIGFFHLVIALKLPPCLFKT